MNKFIAAIVVVLVLAALGYAALQGGLHLLAGVAK